MNKWLKEQELVEKIFGGVLILAIIPLFTSIYLDQYIMLLTLLGLMINNLGKEHCLYKIRSYLGKCLILLAKFVAKTFMNIAIFMISGLIIAFIFHQLGFITNFPKEIFSFSKETLLGLGIYIGFFTILIIFFRKVSKFIEESENKQNKENISNSIYYGFLFTVYFINFIVRFSLNNNIL